MGVESSLKSLYSLFCSVSFNIYSGVYSRLLILPTQKMVCDVVEMRIVRITSRVESLLLYGGSRLRGVELLTSLFLLLGWGLARLFFREFSPRIIVKGIPS